MRTDRELLVLAAKAAGIAIVPCTCSDVRWPFKHDEAVSGKRGHWNPREDDGDALRLAVALGMTVCANFRGWIEGESGSLAHVKPHDPCYEHHGADPAAATRLAIVRAAAEIGAKLVDRENGVVSSEPAPAPTLPAAQYSLSPATLAGGNCPSCNSPDWHDLGRAWLCGKCGNDIPF